MDGKKYRYVSGTNIHSELVLVPSDIKSGAGSNQVIDVVLFQIPIIVDKVHA